MPTALLAEETLCDTEGLRDDAGAEERGWVAVDDGGIEDGVTMLEEGDWTAKDEDEAVEGAAVVVVGELSARGVAEAAADRDEAAASALFVRQKATPRLMPSTAVVRSALPAVLYLLLQLASNESPVEN